MMDNPEKLKLGISACLLGEKVRYDGQHQHDQFITDTLGQYVEFVPVCPEVECGLGVPRETMRLTGNPKDPKLMTTHTGIDHTDRMKKWAQKRVKELEKENLCGFLFKSKSPGCGMELVKVYITPKKISKTGIGMYAKTFMDHFPLLPVEDNDRLHDIKLRENFIERIFAYKR